MGNNSSRSSDHTYGSIIVKLDKPRYFAGETVTGTVYMTLHKPFPSNAIGILFTGKEKIHYVKMIVQGAGSRYVEFEKKSKNFHEAGFYLQELEGQSEFPAGDHSFPFSIELDKNFKNSFMHGYKSENKTCYGKIQYKLEAVMQDAAKKHRIFGTTWIIVDQIWPNYPSPQKFSQDFDISGFVGRNLGKLGLHVTLDKERYVHGEEVHFKIEVDNSSSNADIKYIQCVIKHNLIFQPDGPNGEKTERLAGLDYTTSSKIRKGEKKMGKDALNGTLALPKRHLLDGSCDGELIKSEFFIVVTANMDSMGRSKFDPSATLKIIVINRDSQEH